MHYCLQELMNQFKVRMTEKNPFANFSLMLKIQSFDFFKLKTSFENYNNIIIRHCLTK